MDLGDFDGDGDFDVVTANSSEILIFLDGGDGSLGKPTSYTPAPVVPASDVNIRFVVPGDFNETGFLVEPPTPKALAKRISQLVLENPQRLSEAAKAAHSAWRERYSLERYQRQLLGIVAQSLHRRPA